jgi:hypothetical protein
MKARSHSNLAANWAEDLLKPLTTILNKTTIKTEISIDENTTKVIKTLTFTIAAAIVTSAYLKARK